MNDQPTSNIHKFNFEKSKDLRPDVFFPKKQVPGIVLVFGTVAIMMWSIIKLAKSNRMKK